MIALHWGAFIGEDERTHILLYKGHPIVMEALQVVPQIVEDPVGEYGAGLRLIVYSRDVKLAEETHWGLALFGDPMNCTNYDYLSDLIEEKMGLLINEAHLNLDRMIAKTEATLKELKGIVHDTSYVILVSGEKTIKVTKELARKVFIRGRNKAIVPTRFFRPTADTVICYNERNIELGRIRFDPTDTTSHLGLSVLGPGGNDA